jgi:DNA repair photolyase
MTQQKPESNLIPLETGRRVKRIEMVEVKSVLTAQPSYDANIPFGYTINPYRGCIFGCSYCYASKFVFEDAGKKADWGWWVEVKENAVAVLQKESHKLTGASVFLGSATDPYQPVELRVGLTRALLEVLLFAFPARLHIQTRSPFVTRDIELLQRFGNTLTVGVSIPTDSEVVRKAFEPRAPSIPHRLEAARKLKEAGIQTIASVAPLLPCTPKRLAHLLAPRVHKAWVGTMQFYEKADVLREIFTSRNWERYLTPSHAESVRTALSEVMTVH